MHTGTDKTSTIVALLSILSGGCDRNVLLCAPTNVAVREIAHRFLPMLVRAVSERNAMKGGRVASVDAWNKLEFSAAKIQWVKQDAAPFQKVSTICHGHDSGATATHWQTRSASVLGSGT